MTDIEKFNLLWLYHAMTVSNNCQERYYYDIENQKLFYTTQPSSSSETFDLLDSIDLEIVNEERVKLLRRMKNLDSNTCEVLEIPRLTVVNKVQIQLLFLLKIEGVYHHSNLIQAVEQQVDDYKFVLDKVLPENDLSAPIVQHWEEFKLRTMYNCISRFACATRVDVSISS